MKVELVDLEEFSGNKAHIYSVLLDDAEDTLFDQFVEENGPLYPNEIREIVKELIAMGNKVGCQEHFFKLNEGRLGDGSRNKMRSDKIRFSTGSNYQLNPNNNLQLYYRYHIFNVDDPVNYRHAIGICYTHRF